MSEDDLRSLADSLGLPAKDSLEDHAPRPPDYDQIRAYIDRSLDLEFQDEVGYYIVNYRDWREAHNRLLLRQAGVAEEEPSAEDGPSVDYKRVAALYVLLKVVQSRRMMAVLAATACVVLVGVLTWWGQRPNILFRDGDREVVLLDDGISGFEGFSAHQQARAEKALRNGLEKPPLVTKISDTLPVVRSAERRSPLVVYPVMTAIRERQPTLRWNRVREADAYRVRILDSTGTFVDGAEGINGTSWQVTRPLTEGGIFTWQMFVLVEDREFLAPKSTELPAVFKVLSVETVERISKIEQQLSGSHFLLFLLFFREGLLHEASAELRLLREEDPGSKTLEKLEAQFQEIRFNDSEK